MKIRVADYIANFLVDNNIKQMFSVTGGGAMFLNDAFGHKEGLNVVYNHNEQGCSVCAEGYTRTNGDLCAICVTTGPGGTNAITGVMGAWLDSIPMFVVSGQVKYVTTIKSTKVPLRQLGDQEFPITDCVNCMTKYSYMVTEPESIKYHLEKAFYLMVNGRPGPVWLDIPINVQSAMIETDNLNGFTPPKSDIPSIEQSDIDFVFNKIKNAKKPVILFGEGVRIANVKQKALALAEKLGIPVVTAWNAHDLISDTNPLSCGRPGTVGTRGGNIVLQSADFVLNLACRLNIRQISYNYENFAKNAFLTSVDIDKGELDKPTLSVDKKIHGDVSEFLDKALATDYQKQETHFKWVTKAKGINVRYPACLPEYRNSSKYINPYVFATDFSKTWSEDEVVVCSNGSACVCTFQGMIVKENQRIFTNSGCASMGYGLPASIGACMVDKNKRVICIEGDGSIMMNLQELMTASYNKLNLKIFVLNNNGYHSIRQTQTNIFNSNFCGINKDNGVSFPDFKTLAKSCNLKYYKIDKESKINALCNKILNKNETSLIEVMIDEKQFFSPKLSAKRNPDGTIVSPSLEDMSPFLPEEELREAME